MSELKGASPFSPVLRLLVKIIVMAEVFRSNSCCGVRELGGLTEQSGHIVRAVWRAIHRQNKNGAFYWFADNDGAGNGRRFAAYIKKYGLGELHEHGPRYNPQSRRQLRMWVWEIDIKAIDAFIAKYGAGDDEDFSDDEI